MNYAVISDSLIVGSQPQKPEDIDHLKDEESVALQVGQYVSCKISFIMSLLVLSILLLATYPFMANLHGTELKILINIASLLKNMFAATITIACNILQNTAVTQEQRGVANGISNFSDVNVQSCSSSSSRNSVFMGSEAHKWLVLTRSINSTYHTAPQSFANHIALMLVALPLLRSQAGSWIISCERSLSS